MGEKERIIEEIIKKERAVYACMVCKEMFKEPGMCPNCNVVLKKKAG